MQKEETKDKGKKAKPADCGFAPAGHGMSEMISKCCTSLGGFPDCSTMKGMMETMKNQPCCTSGEEGAQSEGEIHEKVK